MITEFLKSFIQTVTDSLFPISNADKIIFSYTREQAFQKLTKSSKTPIENTYSVFSYKNDLVTRLVWNIKYKKDMRAVRIGGYALWRKMDEIINDQFSMINLSISHGMNNQIPITNDPPFASFYAKATKDKKTTEGKPKGKQLPIINDSILLIPIPISNKRRSERGFNQCELLADEILQLDKPNRLIAYKDLLIRIVHKDRQTLKGREERLEDAKNIFSINEESLKSIKKTYLKPNLNLGEKMSDPNKDISLRNMAIIIIDDVITTGSTIKEAIETLRLAGFDNVTGISLAH